jgi:hypothetical protein
MEKKGKAIGICWRRFHPLYDYFFGIGERIEKLLKLLLHQPSSCLSYAAHCFPLRKPSRSLVST